MAARMTKGSGAEGDAKAVPPDEEYDSTYEDDLLELVERLARRRSQPGRRPARAEPADEVAAEAEPDADDAPEGTKPGTAKSEVVQTNAAKTNAATADTAKSDTAQSDTAQSDTAKLASPGSGDTAEDDADDAGDGADSGNAVKADETMDGGRVTGRIRVLTILSTVLATVLAVVSTFAFMQWRQYASDSSPQAVRQQVAARAGVIVSALYSYDYHDAKGYLEKQAAVLTRATAAQVKPNWTTLATLIESGKYVSTAQIEQVYVGDVSGDKASVIVVLNNKLVTSKGIQNSVGATLQFGLLKEKGVWLANAVPVLKSGGEQTTTDLQGKPLEATTPAPDPKATKQ